MAHYVGPKGRVNRRLGALVFESSGAAKALEKRSYPPGMHTRRGKMSNYGIALNEKQKIKYYYGLSERQLRRYFESASKHVGNTGEQLLMYCERRLDNVVRRAGFAATRPQARQGVTHCHFLVNGVKTNKPSFLVRPGDVVQVRPRGNLQNNYKLIADAGTSQAVPWLNADVEALKVTVLGYPGPQDISLPVEVGLVVEFLSR
ncbi:MAG: 30S ribosomal protein S4 [Planctomycetia bacterium]